jgi:hypothetical protein
MTRALADTPCAEARQTARRRSPGLAVGAGPYSQVGAAFLMSPPWPAPAGEAWSRCPESLSRFIPR